MLSINGRTGLNEISRIGRLLTNRRVKMAPKFIHGKTEIEGTDGSVRVIVPTAV